MRLCCPAYKFRCSASEPHGQLRRSPTRWKAPSTCWTRAAHSRRDGRHRSVRPALLPLGSTSETTSTSRCVANVDEPPPSRLIALSQPSFSIAAASSAMVIPVEYGDCRPSTMNSTTLPSCLMPTAVREVRVLLSSPVYALPSLRISPKLEMLR